MTTANQTSTDDGGQPRVALELIGRSPWNRTRFDLDKLKELRESVKEKGILQPLVIRKNPGYEAEPMGSHKGKWWVRSSGHTPVESMLDEAAAKKMVAALNAKPWELVAGERRWTVAREVGLVDGPVVVREASDKEAIEEQAIENLQREGLNPIDEAEKYRQLLDLAEAAGVSKSDAVTSIRHKTGVSESTIYDRLKLLDLAPKVKAATQEGKLGASLAVMITKLKGEKAQTEAMAQILKPGNHQLSEDTAGEEKKMSVRAAENVVASIAKDMKNEEEYQELVRDFTAKGQKVLTAAENKKAFPNKWSSSPESNLYIKGDSSCPPNYDKTWKQAMGKLAPPLALGRNPNGEAVLMYPTAEAKAAVKKNTAAQPKKAKPERKASAEELRAKAEREERKRVFEETTGKVAEAAEKLESPEIWRWIVSRLIANGGDFEDICARRKIAMTGEGYDKDEKALLAAMEKMNGKQLRGLAVELLFVENSSWIWRAEPEMAEACKVFGVKTPDWKVKVQTPGKVTKTVQILATAAVKKTLDKMNADITARNSKAKPVAKAKSKGTKGKK